MNFAPNRCEKSFKMANQEKNKDSYKVSKNALNYLIYSYFS